MLQNFSIYSALIGSILSVAAIIFFRIIIRTWKVSRLSQQEIDCLEREDEKVEVLVILPYPQEHIWGVDKIARKKIKRGAYLKVRGLKVAIDTVLQSSIVKNPDYQEILKETPDCESIAVINASAPASVAKKLLGNTFLRPEAAVVISENKSSDSTKKEKRQLCSQH